MDIMRTLWIAVCAILLADKGNPTDLKYDVINLDPLYLIVSDTNTTVEVTGDGNIDKCHYRAPTGQVFESNASAHFLGVTIDVNNTIGCRISVGPIEKQLLGEWEIIARFSNNGNFTTKRQIFFLIQEEQVEAIPQDLVISEGNDLFVRLKNPTNQHGTCKLTGPEGDEVNAIRNTKHVETCGFLVKGIGFEDQGTWEIVYGKNTIYRAPVEVVVIEKNAAKVEDLVLDKDTKVDRVVGPENAIYCRLEDPMGIVIFDEFSQCKLFLKRVTMQHDGVWSMLIGLPQKIFLPIHNFVVHVKTTDIEVTTAVQIQQTSRSVTLSCSVPGIANVRACKFRDPSKSVFIATQGVGRDKYVADGVKQSYMSNVSSHECSLRITNLTVEDLGLWRCDVETDVGTHYGFLAVVCPWLINGYEVEVSELSEPILTASSSDITAIEGEKVTMSCSIESAIRYCYFRASNATVFSVTPETSSLEYVGDGFNAGDCGVRFKGLVAADSGNWSCHVGLSNSRKAEQRAQFQVTVQEPITVRHYWHELHKLVVEANVHAQRMLRYCRFVRSDGLGFTPDNMPHGYRFRGSLGYGHCLLQIEEVSLVNIKPWTVAVKIIGEDVERSRQTTDNMLWIKESGHILTVYLWLSITVIALAVLTIGIALGPKKNRRWTYNKATRLRNSLRNSTTAA